MRTVKKTHNIKLRKNVRLGEMGSKYCWVVKIGFQKKYVQLEIVSGWDLTTTIMAAGRGGSKERKSNNEGRLHSCALLRRPTTLS